jgi:hypothetical protein
VVRLLALALAIEALVEGVEHQTHPRLPILIAVGGEVGEAAEVDVGGAEVKGTAAHRLHAQPGFNWRMKS